VFLASLKAAGLGTNLTAGSHVHMMDPWWNPAVEDQAMVSYIWLAFCSEPASNVNNGVFWWGLLCCLCPMRQLLAA
jgi:hypothetical protein